MQFRPLAKRDLPALAQMYTYYALHTVYTYYCYPASASYMGELFKGRGHLCAVAAEEDCAVGYVHIAPSFSFSRKRCTVAVYLQPEFTNRGIGPHLYSMESPWRAHLATRSSGPAFAAKTCVRRPCLRIWGIHTLAKRKTTALNLNARCTLDIMKKT